MATKKRTARRDGPVTNYILANEKTAVNLAAKKDIAVVFHPISDPPQEDGTYNVLSYFGGIRFVDYTVSHGWNTSYNKYTGEVYTDHAFTAEEFGLIAWAPAVPGCKEVEA